MKTTGIFTLHKYVIRTKYYNKPILIVPFGDIHRNSKNCHLDKWLDFCNWAKKQDNAYFLGMGDYNDFLSSSERVVFNNSNIHTSSHETFDDLHTLHTEQLYDEISFMNGNVIGMIEGNHYGVYSDTGITTTQKLCELLKCKYLGVSSFVRLIIKMLDGHTAGVVDIWAHHGLSGGRTLGCSVNKLETMIKMADADIFLMGHDHRKSVAMVSRLGLTDSRKSLTLKNRKIVLARTGSFLKGYVPDRQSYVADACMSPTDLGTISIQLTPQRKVVNDVDTREIMINAGL